MSTLGTFSFWFFAVTAIAGAVGLITRRNAVSAVMCLVGTILSLAALYALLFAHFLAAIQVLVYAGAIMVLFVFVIMIINKEEDAPWALRGLAGKVLALVSLMYLLSRLAVVLWSVRLVPETAWRPGELESFGTTRALGRELFSTYLLPFEAVSLALLVAVVGALVLVRPNGSKTPGAVHE